LIFFNNFCFLPEVVEDCKARQSCLQIYKYPTFQFFSSTSIKSKTTIIFLALIRALIRALLKFKQTRACYFRKIYRIRSHCRHTL